MKNKLTTLGYFIKRMRDCGYIVWRLYKNFGVTDTRKWVVVLNPGRESAFIVCNVNKGDTVEPSFTIHKDGLYLSSDTEIRTKSVEIIVNHLVRLGITPDSDKYKEVKVD